MNIENALMHCSHAHPSNASGVQTNVSVVRIVYHIYLVKHYSRCPQIMAAGYKITW